VVGRVEDIDLEMSCRGGRRLAKRIIDELICRLDNVLNPWIYVGSGDGFTGVFDNCRDCRRTFIRGDIGINCMSIIEVDSFSIPRN